MLLSIFAIAVGATIGRLRGGSRAGLVSMRFRGKAFLVLGVAATLVQSMFDPSRPMLWLTFAFVGYIGFALSNLAVTGMIVLLIGLLMNLAPVLANGAVPVSELALQSVGEVDESGLPVIDGPRESTVQASTLDVFGDIIPVPIVDTVVSLGDLVALVALADIVMNLLLRSRDREPDDAGISFAAHAATEPDPTDSSPAGPAHAAPGRLRLLPPLPRVRPPMHAPSPPAAQPPPPSGEPLLLPPPLDIGALREETEQLEQAEEVEPAIDLRDGHDPTIDLTDRRPIIDLTVSPTDQQMAEFLRRRADADRRLAEAQLAPVAPGHRRNRTRARRRHRGLVDSRH